MIAWYNALEPIEQSFALVAIAATTILFLQTAMLIFGLGLHGGSDDGGLDGHDHDGLDGQVDAGGHDSFDSHDIDGVVDHAEPAWDADTHDDIGDHDTHHFEIDDDGPDFGHQQHEASSHGHGHDAAPEPSLRLFTLRGIVAFFSLAGWSGLVALQSKWSLPAVFGAAFIAGAIGSYTVAKVLQVFLKLQDSGNVHLDNAIGLEAEVYLRVPANCQGQGKITMLLQERYVEIEAVTRGDTDLKPGSRVVVTDLMNVDAVVVRAASRPNER